MVNIVTEKTHATAKSTSIHHVSWPDVVKLVAEVHNEEISRRAQM